jgi:hypothetical protein
MSPHTEKVYGAGVNRFGYSRETAPVVRPNRGRVLARALTVYMPR